VYLKGSGVLAYPERPDFTLTPKSVFFWNTEYKAGDAPEPQEDIFLCDGSYKVSFSELHPKRLTELKKLHKKLSIKKSVKAWYNNKKSVIDLPCCGVLDNPKRLKRRKFNSKDNIKTIQYCYECYGAIQGSESNLNADELVDTDGSNESSGEAGVSINVNRKRDIQELFNTLTTYKKGYAHYVIADARKGGYLDKIDKILNSTKYTDKSKVSRIKRIHNGK